MDGFLSPRCKRGLVGGESNDQEDCRSFIKRIACSFVLITLCNEEPGAQVVVAVVLPDSLAFLFKAAILFSRLVGIL